MPTLIIQIGNSDGKLTDHLWRCFMSEVYDMLEMRVREIHFAAGSTPVPQAPWQNACFVCDAQGADHDDIDERLKEISRRFGQESVAVTRGTTVFI